MAADTSFNNLSPEQLRTFKEAFELFDKNGDGSITTPELGQLMRTVGFHPSEAQLSSIIQRVDENGTGKIEFHEFLTIMSHQVAESETPDAMVDAFKVFDRKQTGFVSVAEFRRIMSAVGDNKLPDEEVDAMIQFADPDQSGKIAYEPFVRTVLAPIPTTK